MGQTQPGRVGCTTPEGIAADTHRAVALIRAACVCVSSLDTRTCGAAGPVLPPTVQGVKNQPRHVWCLLPACRGFLDIELACNRVCVCVCPFHPLLLCCAGEHLAPHTPTILSAIAAGTTHPSPLVQTAALTAIEPLLPFVTDDLVPAFHQLLAALLPCAQAAVASGNEDLLVLLCQVRLQLHKVHALPVPWQQPYSAIEHQALTLQAASLVSQWARICSDLPCPAPRNVPSGTDASHMP